MWIPSALSLNSELRISDSYYYWRTESDLFHSFLFLSFSLSTEAWNGARSRPWPWRSNYVVRWRSPFRYLGRFEFSQIRVIALLNLLIATALYDTRVISICYRMKVCRIILNRMWINCEKLKSTWISKIAYLE